VEGELNSIFASDIIVCMLVLKNDKITYLNIHFVHRSRIREQPTVHRFNFRRNTKLGPKTTIRFQP